MTAVDCYARAYDKAGTDVIKTALSRLLNGRLSEFGGNADYTQVEKDFARALAPHFAGLYADLWNRTEMEPHDILDADRGAFRGCEAASALAAYVAATVQPSDMNFTVRHIPDGQTETDVCLDFAEMFNKLKSDFCDIIRITAQEKQESLQKLTPHAPKFEPANAPKPGAPKPQEPYENALTPY